MEGSSSSGEERIRGTAPPRAERAHAHAHNRDTQQQEAAESHPGGGSQPSLGPHERTTQAARRSSCDSYAASLRPGGAPATLPCVEVDLGPPKATLDRGTRLVVLAEGGAWLSSASPHVMAVKPVLSWWHRSHCRNFDYVQTAIARLQDLPVLANVIYFQSKIGWRRV